MFKFLVLNIFLISLIGCDFHDDRLMIINESTDTIFVDLTLNQAFIEHLPVEFDSLNGNIDLKRGNPALPDSSYKFSFHGRNGVKDFINRCEDSTLTIFIFTKELIMNNSWDSIKSNQLYSKKILLTLDELEKLNWRVIYK